MLHITFAEELTKALRAAKDDQLSKDIKVYLRKQFDFH